MAQTVHAEPPRFLRPKDAAAYFGVTVQTLRRWERRGLINAILSAQGRVQRYDVSTYGGASVGGRVVVYVSQGGGGKAFLERQITHLLSLYPKAEVIADENPTPGDNGDGPLPRGLTRLVEGIAKREITKLVVTSYDRFGLLDADCFIAFARRLGCKIIETGGGAPPNDIALSEARIAVARLNIRLERLLGGRVTACLTVNQDGHNQDKASSEQG